MQTGLAPADAGRFRVEGIDALRGLSVLFVVLHHIHIRFKMNGFPVAGVLPRMLDQVLFWSGYYAVIAFFVISGFLITNLSMRRWSTLGNIDLGRFYVLRAARILPCLLLLIAVLSTLHIAGAGGFVIDTERASLGRTVLAALTFHVNWLEGHHGYLPGGWDVLWSLSVEEVFYLAFPLLCLTLRSERLLIVPLVLLIVIGPINRAQLTGVDPWQDYAYLSCMDGIAFGCLAALLAARVRLSRQVLLGALTVGVVAVTSIVVFRAPTAWLGLTNTGLHITVLELGVALVLVALSRGVGNDALTRGTGLIRSIGRASYEIYLVHMFVVLGLTLAFKAWNLPPATIPVAYLVMLALSAMLGKLVARVFSEPMNAWLRSRATDQKVATQA